MGFEPWTLQSKAVEAGSNLPNHPPPSPRSGVFRELYQCVSKALWVLLPPFLRSVVSHKQGGHRSSGQDIPWAGEVQGREHKDQPGHCTGAPRGLVGTWEHRRAAEDNAAPASLAQSPAAPAFVSSCLLPLTSGVGAPDTSPAELTVLF